MLYQPPGVILIYKYTTFTTSLPHMNHLATSPHHPQPAAHSKPSPSGSISDFCLSHHFLFLVIATICAMAQLFYISYSLCSIFVFSNNIIFDARFVCANASHDQNQTQPESCSPFEAIFFQKAQLYCLCPQDVSELSKFAILAFVSIFDLKKYCTISVNSSPYHDMTLAKIFFSSPYFGGGDKVQILSGASLYLDPFSIIWACIVYGIYTSSMLPEAKFAV